MRRALWLVVAVALVVGLSGCAQGAGGGNMTGNSTGNVTGNGNSKTETRAVSGITAVALATSGELTIEQTGTESLTITAEANILPQLTSDVVGGTLRLGTKPNTSLQSNSTIQYHLTVKQLHGITVAGSGDATMNALQTDTLSLTLSGSGNLTLGGLAANAVTAVLSGSGGITAKGQSQSELVTLSGSGNYEGTGLSSASVTVTVAGSGNARVQASQSLNATVSGSGTILYSGNPSQVSSTVTGSGTIARG